MSIANKVDCSKIKTAMLQSIRHNKLWVDLRFLLELSGKLNRDSEEMYENQIIQLPKNVNRLEPWDVHC